MNKDEIISEARLRQIHTLESAIEKRNMRIRRLEKTLGKTSVELLDDNERLSMQCLFYEMDWHIAMRRVVELEAQLEREKWHRYPEEKPHVSKQYMIQAVSGYVGIEWWRDDQKWSVCNQLQSQIIHWRELPAPPEEEK